MILNDAVVAQFKVLQNLPAKVKENPEYFLHERRLSGRIRSQYLLNAN
jgi:hypothetical protein